MAGILFFVPSGITDRNVWGKMFFIELIDEYTGIFIMYIEGSLILCRLSLF
jgi:hypothetical protein